MFQWINVKPVKDLLDFSYIVLHIISVLVKMIAEARAISICDIPGCTNAAEMDSEYCSKHNPISSLVTHTKCIVDGCTNSADINEKFLCNVCFHASKLTLGHINTRVNDDIAVPTVKCKIGGCNKTANFNGTDMCDSCHIKIGNDPFQKYSEFLPKKKNIAYTADQPIRSLEYKQILFAGCLAPDNNSQEIRNTNNLIPKNKSTKRNMICMHAGCDNTILLKSKYCMEHEKQMPVNVCVMEGCTNRTEFTDDTHLCLICLQTRNNSLRQLNNYNHLLSCPIDTAPKSLPTPRVSTLMRDKSTGRGKSCKASFDFSVIANSLPPIPSPRYMPPIPAPTKIKYINPKPNIQDTQVGEVIARGASRRECIGDTIPRMPVPTKIQYINPKPNIQDTQVGEVIAWGASRQECIGDTIPSIPIPLGSLPPIPLPFSRSNSTPEVKPQFTQPLHVHAVRLSACSLPCMLASVPSCKRSNCNIPASNDGYCSKCSIDANITSISVNSDKQVMEANFPNDLLLAEFNESSSPRQICKAVDCKFFVNEGLGGYCSECFMCFNITDNIPPSPTRKFSFDMLGMEEEYESGNYLRFESQLCKGGTCEFFGNEDFGGYCSGCYKLAPLKKDLNNRLSFIDDDDDKMCIICIQNPYNTVLLPCGHLYLCFECATTIKDKGDKCPACRCHIASVHRVYRPN